MPATENALTSKRNHYPLNVHAFKVVSMPNLNDLINSDASSEHHSDLSDDSAISPQLYTTSSKELNLRHGRRYII